MIRLKDVSKFYYNKGIIASGFNKVSCEFDLGEFVVITGESGSGKSTLLNVISGLDTYEEGEMYINGKETSHYTEEDFENYRKKYISNIFQNFNLVNSYTVYQNIELVLLINGYKKHEVKKKIIDIIKEVDLLKYKNTKVSKLSGGQKQRVAIARALAKNTPIIIADEPTGNLDTKSATSVMKTLSEVAKDKLVIVVTHNYEQMAEYATRKITMHDGKIIEDKIISRPPEIKINEDNKFNYLRPISKIRLGIRNAFNIKTKFILLLMVYLFMGCALIAEHAAFQKSNEAEDLSGYNQFFGNTSKNRLIIKKNDKKAFTDEDYQKLTKISNIDYLVKSDYQLDSEISMFNDDNGFTGNFNPLNTIKKVDKGMLPTKDNEIVISGSKDDNFLSNPEKTLNKEYTYTDLSTNISDPTIKFTIVGIIYSDDYETNFYGNDKLFNILNKKMIGSKSKFTYTLNNHELDDKYIKIIDKVPAGNIYINKLLNYNCNNYDCLYSTLNIKETNMYYSHDINLKVTATLNNDNFKALTGLKNSENYNDFLFINPADYNSLFENSNYQSSVFVKDYKKIKDTKKDIEKLGYNALIVTDTLAQFDSGFIYVLNIVNLVVTSILVIVMFFLSYFIIKLILKSRNTYYSTLRILGSNKKDARKLLEIELLTIANLSLIIIYTFITLVNKKIIVSKGIKNLLTFMTIKDYLFIYVSVVLMTYLIAIKFAKSLFKNSAMKTYNEEA